MARGGTRPDAGRRRIGRNTDVHVGATMQREDAQRLERIARKAGISCWELVRCILEAFVVTDTWVRKGA